MRRRLAMVVLLPVLAACSFWGGGTPSPSPMQAPTSAPTASGSLSALATAAAAATTAPQPTTAPATTPSGAVVYTRAECAFDVPRGARVSCGYLVVPEDRAAGDGRTIRLHVAVFRSDSARPLPDPVVYLEGGPGGNALEAVPFIYDDIIAPFLDERDVIVFDQRGTGLSEPALDCPELIELGFETLDDDLTMEQAEKLYVDTTLACRDRLASEGVNLSAYTSAASAADLEDMRVALGYGPWNLYGISYGTRLALTAARDFPQGVRSMILDSSAPPQVSMAEIPAKADRVFRLLFDTCARDATCAGTYPDLEQAFYQAVERLEAQPVRLPVVDFLTSQNYVLLLDGESLLGLLFRAFYSTQRLPQLPLAIYAARDGIDYSFWADVAMLDVIQGEYFSDAMHYSVRCAEEFPFVTRAEMVAADESYPQQRDAFDMESFYDICAAWGARAAGSVEDDPVTSSIPALVMAGEFDPITPPAQNALTAETLPASYYFEFPAMGHGVTPDDACPQAIMLAFVDDPTREPDSSCIARMRGLEFQQVGDGPALRTFEDTDFGIRGVVPRGWRQITTATYGVSDDGPVIIQYALPGDRQQALAAIIDQFDIEFDPDPAGTVAAGGRTWQRFRVGLGSLPAELALAEGVGRTYAVLLVHSIFSEVLERVELFETVFVPALEALQPLQ